MLIRITNVCKMGCNHCMVDAKPEGEFMTMDTFKDVMAFVNRFEFKIAMLSGGEPTEHPDLIKMIELLKSNGIKTLLLSNGMFMNDNPEIFDFLKKNDDVFVQITNDSRFYPKKFEKPDYNITNFGFEDHIRLVSPFGRAIVNKLECTRQSPLCFNLRSICRKLKDFEESVMQLRVRQKMCIPSINPDGSLVAGESSSCHVIGKITDNNLALTNNVCEMKCNKCGLVSSLLPEYKNAIGEL